jgi:hypothetical protein
LVRPKDPRSEAEVERNKGGRKVASGNWWR